MNSMRFYQLFILSILAVLFLGSCDKKEDSEYPVIAVSSPLPLTNFENGDTIRLNAVFKDNTRLSNVEVILVDQDNKPMLGALSITPASNPFTLSGDYIINDVMLPGGKYQLRFQASDGTNVSNYFIELNIHETERELLYPLIVTHPETEKWQAFRLINDVWKSFYVHTGDYIGSAVNPTASQLYMCGIKKSDLTAIRLTDGIVQWHANPELHQSQRWFEGISYSYPYLYISCAAGHIRAYDKSGSEKYRSAAFENAVPGPSVVTQNLVISYFKDAFSNDRFLISFHNQGGLMINNRFIQADVVGLMNMNNDNVLVFGNVNGQGDISYYNGTDNILTSLHPLYEGTFYKIAAMDTDNYLVSGSAGIYWYKYSNNSLVPFDVNFKNAILACDNTSQLVYACKDKIMNVYTFPFAVVSENISLPDTAVDLHLVFNK